MDHSCHGKWCGMAQQRGVYAGLFLVLAGVSCGGGGEMETPDSEAPAGVAPESDVVAEFREALLPNCPPTSTDICYALAATSGNCCRCDGGYGRWTANPFPFRGFTCNCYGCSVSSASNLTGMCCSCGGTKAKLVAVGEGQYTCDYCRTSCQMYSTTSLTGLCCICNGVKGKFVPGPTSNVYKCDSL
jgi:hypothetical protein